MHAVVWMNARDRAGIEETGARGVSHEAYIRASRSDVATASPKPHISLRAVTSPSGTGDTSSTSDGVPSGPAREARATSIRRTGTAGDLGGRHPVDALGVIGAEHEDQQVHGCMRQQARVQVREAISARSQWRIPDRGAAVEPFFDDLVAVSERRRHDTRPADITWQAGRPGWVCAVGVAVTETNDGASQRLNLLEPIDTEIPSIRGTDRCGTC